MGRRWSAFYLVPALTLIWYAFPMTYIDYLPVSDYSTITNEQAWTSIYEVSIICALGPILSILFKNFNIDAPYDFKIDVLKTSFVIFVISLIQIYAMYIGFWRYGVTLLYASSLEKSQLTLIVAFAARPLMAISGLLLALNFRRRDSGALLAAALLIAAMVTQFAWLSIEGRRVLAINVIISFIVFVRYFHAGNKISLSSIVRYAVFCVIASGVVSVSWSVYYTLRQLNYSIDISRLDISEIISMVIERSGAYSSSSSDNFASRPFLLVESFGYVTGAVTGLGGGAGILSSFMQAIPSAFWPEKASIVSPDVEHVWSALLGVKLNDWSNTLLLEGLVDFGYFGFFVHLGLITMIANFIKKLLSVTGSNFLSMFYFVTFLAVCATIEVSATEYFVWARNLVASCLVLGLIKWIFYRRASVERMPASARRGFQRL